MCFLVQVLNICELARLNRWAWSRSTYRSRTLSNVKDQVQAPIRGAKVDSVSAGCRGPEVQWFKFYFQPIFTRSEQPYLCPGVWLDIDWGNIMQEEDRYPKAASRQTAQRCGNIKTFHTYPLSSNSNLFLISLVHSELQSRIFLLLPVLLYCLLTLKGLMQLTGSIGLWLLWGAITVWPLAPVAFHFQCRRPYCTALTAKLLALLSSATSMCTVVSLSRHKCRQSGNLIGTCELLNDVFHRSDGARSNTMWTLYLSNQWRGEYLILS